jgi:hypothetical protein
VIQRIKLEHVWVEAWVDMVPSRAARHIEGDNWAMLDASFKQYEYSEGMAIQEGVPFDAQAFAEELRQSATVNEAEGWVQGVDQALVQQRLNEYQDQIEAFVNGQDPEATVADVLGAKAIVQRTSTMLGSHLPYEHLATTDSFAELPQSLRWKFQYQLQDQWGGQVLTFTDSLPRLAGKKLALSFKPATQADEDLIASYLPTPPADGSSIDPAELPKSLPGYLIHLVPEWTVGGTVVARGSASSTMGGELKSARGLWRPGEGWRLRDKVVTAGQYQAMGLDPVGIGRERLAELRTELEATKLKLEAQDLPRLTKHDLTGDIMQTGVLVYLAMTHWQDRLAGQAAGVVTERLPSYGAFETTLQPEYWFGLPRNVRFPGLTMDIDSLHQMAVDKANGAEGFRTFVRSSGSHSSALEHAVPEHLFSTKAAPLHGISAAKALTLAAAEGQRIYTLTQANMAQLGNILIDQAARAEIQNALHAGKEVTVHAAPLSYYGWQGSGYTVIDPETGAGAWKISGGANGGYLTAEDGANITALMLGIIALLSIQVGLLVLILLAIVSAVLSIVATLESLDCPIGGAAVAVILVSALIGFFAGPAEDVARILRANIAAWIAGTGFSSGAAAACAAR